MQKTCINRKGKQRKSSVRRGATENIDHKEQKGLLLLGIDLFTTCKYSPYTAYIRLRPYIRRIYIYIYINGIYIYTVYIYIYIYIRLAKSMYGHTVQIRSEISIHGYGCTAYPDTLYYCMYGSGQPYCCYTNTAGPGMLRDTLASLSMV
jgi:hypothetical protein